MQTKTFSIESLMTRRSGLSLSSKGPSKAFAPELASYSQRPRSRRTSSGAICLHRSKPDPAGDRVAIVVEPATGPRAATVRLEAHGATTREREVTTLIARGLTNPEIAETLVLSPHTVQDHIKSLFAKLDVSSRQELVAKVFLDEYLPEVIQQTPITSHGRFEVD